MFDLMALAYQTDIIRVATFMMGREASNLTYPEISVNRAHHGMTHHRGEPTRSRTSPRSMFIMLSSFPISLENLPQSRKVKDAFLTT